MGMHPDWNSCRLKWWHADFAFWLVPIMTIMTVTMQRVSFPMFCVNGHQSPKSHNITNHWKTSHQNVGNLARCCVTSISTGFWVTARIFWQRLFSAFDAVVPGVAFFFNTEMTSKLTSAWTSFQGLIDFQFLSFSCQVFGGLGLKLNVRIGWSRGSFPARWTLNKRFQPLHALLVLTAVFWSFKLKRFGARFRLLALIGDRRHAVVFAGRFGLNSAFPSQGVHYRSAKWDDRTVIIATEQNINLCDVLLGIGFPFSSDAWFTSIRLEFWDILTAKIGT